MKKNIKIFSVFIIVILFAVLGFIVYMGIKINKESKLFDSIIIKDIDLKKVKDGEYIGKCYLDPKRAKVRVTIKNGNIIKIDLIEHRHGPGYGADEITEIIIRAQKVKVEAISGATKSSIVIKKAVEDALMQGLQ